MDINPGIIDSFAHGVERIGIPAGLIFAGLYLLREFVRGVGPAIAGFLAKLTEKMNEHSNDHTRIGGQLEVHHEKTRASIEAAAAEARAAVDNAKGELLRAVDASADRIVDQVRPSRISRTSLHGGGYDDKTPPSGLPRQSVPVDHGGAGDTHPIEK